MSESTTVFGIDLGTTYSCISYLKDGHPVVCQNLEGENTTPSVVRMPNDTDGAIAGSTAKETAVLYPDQTIQFVKSKIGRIESFDYSYDGGSATTTPEDVSAEILKKLASDAQAYTSLEVRDVVITVPAYFGQNEKQATINAGVKAGLNVVDIVEEPTAAAFYYGCEKAENDETVCIFDLGGGTFDVTAMRIGKDELSVLTTDGDHDLGGKRWDEALMALAEEKFREETGYDDEFDSDILQELIINCEKAKKQLTSANSASFVIKVDRQNRANITITREEFEARTKALLATAIDLTRKVFDRMEERGTKIDKILLVGGSTFMPQVSAAIVKEFGITPELNEPNEAVSKGACIYCAWKLLHGTIGDSMSQAASGTSDAAETEGEKSVISDVQTTDEGTTVITLAGADGSTRNIEITLPGNMPTSLKTVSTKSFGIKAIQGRGNDRKDIIFNMIIKDTALPVEITEQFGTTVANQTELSIELYQSERYEQVLPFIDPVTGVESGVKIGEAMLTGIPAGLPENTTLDVTINLAENGIIVITGAYNGTPLNGALNMEFSEGVGAG